MLIINTDNRQTDRMNGWREVEKQKLNYKNPENEIKFF